MDPATFIVGIALIAWAYTRGKRAGNVAAQALERRTRILEERCRALNDLNDILLKTVMKETLKENKPRPAPPPPASKWRDVFDYHDKPNVTREDIGNVYRRLAKERQADEARLKELNIARDEALKEIRR